MASLASFAGSGVTYTEDFGTGIASITGGVLVINADLDALDDRIHTIDCSSGGGIRSTSGASGILRAGSGRTLNIIERSNANRYGPDNGKQSNSNGSNSRFAGNATNTLIYERINWTIEDGNRSDFDFGAGTNANGSLGTGVTMRGVYVNIEAAANSANNNFPHLWSQNAKLEIDPALGFGLRIANHTQSHGLLIEVQPNAQFAGLVIDDIEEVASGGGRVVCSPPDNTTYTLFNLNTPDITESNNTSTGKTILVDPVGVPTRSNNWDGYNSIMEIQRTINFQFNGADDATGTLVALHQNSNAQAADATGMINSSGAGSVRVITNYSAYQASNGAWASTDGFQFYATSLGFRKYWSGSTTINVGNAPTTRVVAATKDAFPDGSAITAYTGEGAAATASEIYRIIKRHELANPTHRTLGASLATIDGSGNIVVDSTVQLAVSTTQTNASSWDGNTSTLTIKVETGITADKGINSLNFGNRNIPAIQIAYFSMPTTTSSGTSALLRITAPASYRVGVFSSTGTELGSHSYSSAGEHSFLLTAASTGTTKVGMGRTGYDDANIDIDTSAGGVFSHTFLPLTQQVDALGSALYSSTLPTTGISVEFNATGQPTFLIPNSAVSVKQLYKVFHDAYATTDGTKFAAFARQQPGILDLGGAIPNSLFLGSDAQLRRAESSGDNAEVRAVVFGGRGGNRVNDDRGDISIVEQVGGGGGGGADVAGIWNALTDTYQQPGSFGEKLGGLASAVLSVNRFQFNAPFTDDTAISAITGTTLPNDGSGRGWGVLAGAGTLVFNDSGTGVLENGSLLFGTHRPGFTGNAELDFVFQHRITGTHSDATAQPVAQIVNAAGDVVFQIEAIANDSTPTYQMKVIDGSNSSTATLASSTTQNAWHTIAVSIRQDGSYAECRASFDGGSVVTLNVSSNVRELSISDASRASFTAASFSELRNIFFCPRGTQSSATGWAIPAGINWNETNRTYAATDGSVISSVPTPSGGGGSTDLTGVNAKLDANSAKLDQTIEGLEHVATSLPIVFPEGSPLSPLVVICGLAGQSIIRDVESRGYAITPSGVDLDTDARGVMTFSGTNSHIDLSLARTIDGVTTNHTTEIITLLQCRPTAFNATDAQPLFSIGAALVSIAPSSGSTAALRIGVAGAQDTTELLTLNSWNTIVVSFQQRAGAANYPIIRVSVNGGAQQKWNDGSNELFAQIASSTTNFRIGARSTGGNTSVGFIGDARALWVHPNNAIFDDGNGWEIPSGIYWSPLHQLYLGAHLADRVEGVLSDIFEPIITDIDDKTSEIPQNTAAAVMSRSLGQAANANGNFGQRFRWLVENANTTTPPTAAAIATAVEGELTIPTPPSASSIATAVRDVSNASPASNSLGAAVNAIPTTAAPTAAANATAVWSATTSANNTDGSMGARLQDTSTHGAPADSPAATDVAEAVRDISLTNAAANSLGAKLASLGNGPTAADIRDAINDQVINGTTTRLQKERIELSLDTGTFAIVNGRIAFVEPGTTRAIVSADISDAARRNVSVDFGS